MKKCEKKKPVDVFDYKYCNSSYLIQDSLNSHLEICPAPRPCRICNSTFVGKKLLEDHFTISNKNSNVVSASNTLPEKNRSKTMSHQITKKILHLTANPAKTSIHQKVI